MPRYHQLVLVAAVATWLPARAVAQQPTRRQLDSLAAVVHALEARIDSLRRVVQRTLPTAAPLPSARDSSAAGDDLAALRAAAALAAGTRAAGAADTTSATPFVGRERNQAQLNPEIGVTGDVRAYGQTPGVVRENFDAREFEVGFQSALDPYSHTKVFVSLENGDVSVEEGYAYWTGLPGHIRLDVGKFRQQFGELNRWHLHALPESEYPLAVRTYLGEDGLSGTGLSLYRAFGGWGTHELSLQLTRSASDALLFGGAGRPTVLLHLLNFWQLDRSSYVQLGGTALYGTDPDSSLRTSVGGLEFRYTWRPPERALYREWTLRGELLALRKAVAGTGSTHVGGYISTTYKLGQRWIAGLRYDHVEQPDGSGIAWQVVPSLTLWQSEWVYLRAQYTYERAPLAASTSQVALQAVWAIGPHKHETY
jgi:hypothetical protein